MPTHRCFHVHRVLQRTSIRLTGSTVLALALAGGAMG